MASSLDSEVEQLHLEPRKSVVPVLRIDEDETKDPEQAGERAGTSSVPEEAGQAEPHVGRPTRVKDAEEEPARPSHADAAPSRGDDDRPSTSNFKHMGQKVVSANRLIGKADLVYNKNELEFKFQQAAAQGRNKDLRVLLGASHVNVNCTDQEGRTALIYAAAKGHGESVGLLLAAKADVNVQDDYGCTALHYAAGLLSDSCIKSLLQYGASTVLHDAFHRTPLSLAVQAAPRKTDREAAQCISLLVKATLQLTQRDGSSTPSVPSKMLDSTLIDYALGVGDYPATIGVLAELGSAVTEPDALGRSPLYYAVVNQRPNSIRELLSRGCGWTAHVGRNLNALHVAALQGSLPIARTLMDTARKHGVLGDILEAHDQVGFTPLHYAASQGHADMCSVLRNVGASVNAVDSVNGLTPLHVALLHGKASCAETLLRLGAEVATFDARGRTPLHAACACESNDEAIAAVVKTMVSSAGADVSLKDRQGLTGAHIAASRGSVPLLKALVESGADVFTTDKEGRAALHWAAYSGFIDAFLFLSQHMQVERGVDPIECVTTSGRTALHLAAQGRPELLATLLESGFEPHLNRQDTVGGCTALHLAAECGDPDCVALLVDSEVCVIDARDSEGKTPLHYAAGGGHVGCLRILLDKGADIRARSTAGYSALHVAAEAGNAQTCLLLAKEGSDLNHAVPKGMRTALHLAAAKGHTLAAISLVRMGCDASVGDELGRTPVAVALQNGYKETAKEIEHEQRRVRNL